MDTDQKSSTSTASRSTLRGAGAAVIFANRMKNVKNRNDTKGNESDAEAPSQSQNTSKLSSVANAMVFSNKMKNTGKRNSVDAKAAKQSITRDSESTGLADSRTGSATKRLPQSRSSFTKTKTAEKMYRDDDDYESLRIKSQDPVPDKPYVPPPARFVYFMAGDEIVMLNTLCKLVDLKKYIAQKIEHLTTRGLMKHIKEGHFDLLSSKGKLLNISQLPDMDYCQDFKGREIYFPVIWSKDNNNFYEYFEYIGNHKQLEKYHPAVHASIEAIFSQSEKDKLAFKQKQETRLQKQQLPATGQGQRSKSPLIRGKDNIAQMDTIQKDRKSIKDRPTRLR